MTSKDKDAAGWTPEHRQRVGALVRAEMKRRSLKPADVANRIDREARTVIRVRDGDRLAGVGSIMRVTRWLGIPDEDVQPPRPPRAVAQLSRVEAMLRVLLEHSSVPLPSAEFVAEVEAEAQRRDPPQTPDEPSSSDSPPKGPAS